MGSCENSVIVDEPLRLSISGQHLCSELSHTLVDSKMDLASASNRCPDLVSNYNSGSLSSGRITQPCSVKGDGLLGEHKDVNGLGLESLLKDDSGRVGGCTDESCGDVDVFENEIGGECLEEGSFVSREGLVAECEAEAVDVFSLRNLLKNDSGLSRVCLNESHNDIDVREKESGGKCLQEGSFVSRDGSVGKCEAVDVLPVENLLENDSVVSGGCLVEGHNDIDASAKESDEGCLQEDNSVSRDGLGAHYEAVNVLGLSKLLKNDSVVTGGFVEENCIDVDVNENERGGKCLQECSSVGKDGLVGEYEADDVLPLENLLGHDSGHGGVCLDEKHNDIGVLEKESHGECLHEGTSVSKDGSGSEYEAMDILGSDKSLNDSAVSRGCLDENHIDFDASEKESSGEGLREGSSSSRDGLVGEYEAVDVLPLNLLTRVSVYCLDENHSDIDVHEKVNKGKCLEEGSHDDITQMCTIDGDGSVNNHKDLDVLELDNLLENDPDVSGGYLDENHGVINVCNAEGCGESFQEGTSRDEDELGNLKVDSDIHSKVITVADLPTSCVLVDEQKDEKGVCCLFAEKIIGVREDKDDNLAKVSNDLCEQEPPSQDCESSELVPENDLMDNTLEQKEQNFKGDGDPTLGSITGKSVASVGLEADMCNGISDFLQCVELSLEASHSGEEVSSAACKIDQNNSSGCLSIERITEAVGMGSSIDTSNRVILSTSLENVLRYEQMDEKSVDSPSTKGVTEFVQEKNDVTLDTKVDVGTQILALGEIERNDISGSLKYCQPLGLVDDGFSKTLDVPDQLGNSSHGPLESSSTVDCSGKTTDQGNDNEGIDCVSEAKCRDIASSSFQRNSRRSRSNRKTQIKNATRKSKKTAKALCSNGFVKVTFKARKKRSCLSKSARSSAWGLLGNVTQLFEHSNRLEVIQVPKQGSRKPKGGKKSGKQNKNGANIRSQGSRSKSSALNTKIRLKVKLGKGVNQTILNVTVPNVVDNSALPTAVSCDDGTKLGTSAPKAANGEIDDCRKCEVSMHFTCSSSNKEKAMSFPHASVQDAQLVNNDLDTHVLPEKSAQDVKDDCFGICSNVLVEASEGAAESRCKDPGTSPDSEVINLIPDAHVDSRPHDDFHATVTSPKDLAVPADLTSNNRRRKKNKCSGLVNSTEDKLPLPVKINKGKPLKQYGRKQNSNNGICTGENLTSSTSAKALSNSSGDKELSVVEPLLSSVETALRVSTEALKVETGAEANGIGLSKSQKSENFLSPPKTNSRKNPKGKSQGSDSGNKRVNSRSKKQAWCTSVGKKKANETSVCDQVACNVESHPKAENHMVDGKGKANSGENIASSDVSNLEVSPAALGEQYLPPRNAWVRCDSCHKWRRIPAELADSIEETQCSWTCKDNVDKAFADCSAPQEKSNADINAELELSDASGEEDASGTRLTYKGLEYRRLRDLRETPTCISIRTNQYLHRSRKTQTIDEIMVCHCKPPSDGRLGCGDDCLNRMLNIECVQGACPCRDLCSNQQFQKRKYAKLGKFQCGKKGCGLRLLEDISQGKFLIEYVGEVLDMQAYDARQKDYALKGHKHFYFMTLNGSEVIDACIKGNKGRFINHSCDPNCRTEKWMVNGEICIGLFALRDIKKGEEVTFDYNYVRVFGAAAKRCYCGSPQCRGYIGGDPLNGDVIIQSDSDEDYPEPMMLPVIGNAEGRLNKIVLKPSSSVIKKTSESTLDHIDEKDKQTPASVQSELSTGKENSIDHSVSAVSHVHDALELNSMGILSSSVQPLEISQQTEDVSSELISTVQQESSMEEETMEKTPSSSDRLDLTPPVEVGKSLSDSADGKRKSKSDMADDQQLSSKAHLKVKTSHSSSIVKRGKIWSDPPNTSKLQMAANKLQVLHIKPKNVIRGSFGNNFEAVEEKLNELLDADGGISKRKDAAKGYLKLLLLTAASGDSASGEAIQRNRDLSMILDALLKTKSRVVLVDIINKNGLRMLHNIMKQYRRDFKKIPILRKLLKVLEYLAAREILTSEHIHGGPPCPGMESFRESILSLTEHNDRQVHQIARNFRDRWIRRNLRKHGFVDRDDNKVEYLGSSNCNRYSATQNNRSDPCGRPSETIDFIKQSTPPTTLVGESTREGSSASCAGVSPPSGTKTRKRKSRWDQPAEAYSVLISLQHKEQKIESKQFESIVNHREKVNGEESTCLGSVNDSCQVDQAAHEGKENVLEDVPPGFASPLKPVPCSSVTSSTAFHSKCPFETVIGHPQEKFISRLPVSYGIPLSIMQQFGTPHAETAGSWAVAPGLPFHPFPPLPSYPRGKKDKLPSDDVNRLSVNQSAEDAQPDGHLPATSNLNDCTPNTSGDQPAAEILCANNRHTLKRDRETSHDLGRRYFKQHKWNNTKSWPPWHVRRNGWRCMGNLKDGTSSASIGNITNEHRSTYCSEDLNCTVEKAGNNCFQNPEHHSQH